MVYEPSSNWYHIWLEVQGWGPWITSAPGLYQYAPPPVDVHLSGGTGGAAWQDSLTFYLFPLSTHRLVEKLLYYNRFLLDVERI